MKCAGPIHFGDQGIECCETCGGGCVCCDHSHVDHTGAEYECLVAENSPCALKAHAGRDRCCAVGLRAALQQAPAAVLRGAHGGRGAVRRVAGAAVSRREREGTPGWRAGIEAAVRKVNYRLGVMPDLMVPAYRQALLDVRLHLLAMLERGTENSTCVVDEG